MNSSSFILAIGVVAFVFGCSAILPDYENIKDTDAGADTDTDSDTDTDTDTDADSDTDTDTDSDTDGNCPDACAGTHADCSGECIEGECVWPGTDKPCGENACEACDSAGNCTENLPSDVVDPRCNLDCSAQLYYQIRDPGEDDWDVVSICESKPAVAGTDGTCDSGQCKTPDEWCVWDTDGEWTEVGADNNGVAPQCHVFDEGTCFGVTPPDLDIAPQNQPCDDGDWCTINETCAGGASEGMCMGEFPPMMCNDNGTCDSAAEECDCENGWTGDLCDTCLRLVDAAASGGGNGLTWADAFNSVQPAIDDAIATGESCEIWVAAGVYTDEDATTTEPLANITVTLKGDIKLYGGFTSGMDDREDASPWENITVVSGNNTHGTKANHVVSCTNDTTLACNGAVLDGFVVADGANTGGGGAGLTASGGSSTASRAYLEISRCVFTDHTANPGAGAALSTSGKLTTRIRDCVFSNNRAQNGTTGLGGAVSLTGNLNTTEISGSLFTGNISDVGGGALTMSWTSVKIHNSVFAGNGTIESGGNGGAIRATNMYDLYILGSTFFGNYTGDAADVNDGGAIYLEDSMTEAIVLNTIFSGNIPDEIAAEEEATYDMRFSYVEGGCDNTICPSFASQNNASADVNFATVGISGTWTNVGDTAVYDSTRRTRLEGSGFGGCTDLFLKPDNGDNRMFLIQGTEGASDQYVYVWGDVTDFVAAGETFNVYSLHLGTGSACGNTGDPTENNYSAWNSFTYWTWPLDDILGVSRDTQPDMGAYEDLPDAT